MTLLWLDDIRDPFKSPWSNNVEALLLDDLTEKVRDFKLIWVKDYNEFILAVEKSFPAIISFDHDLSFKQMIGEPCTEKTGYDCAKWLINYCIDSNLKLPEFSVHSKNPVGKKNIESLLNNFKNRK